MKRSYRDGECHLVDEKRWPRGPTGQRVEAYLSLPMNRIVANLLPNCA